ncbi:MAG: hypothetical protein WCL35_07115 [bacterium]
MLSIRAKRIALIFVGVVAIASCGGSSTSTPDSPTTLYKKNASLLTAKKQYTGVFSSSEYEGDTTKDYSNARFRSGDQFAFSFVMDLATVDASEVVAEATDLRYLKTDFRSAFSNFKLRSLDGNLGTADISKIKWSKCPPKVEVRKSFRPVIQSSKTTTVEMFRITFFEEAANTVASSSCSSDVNLMSSTSSLIVMFYNFSESSTGTSWELPNSSRPMLKDVLPNGFDAFGVDRNIRAYVYFRDGVESRYRFLNAKSLSSKVVKDYSPFALVATADAAGVSAQWSRSVDLGPDDAATHVVEMSKDNFATVSETKLISQDANMTALLPSCEIDPNNTMKLGTKLSLRVKALDLDGLASTYTDSVVITKSLDNLVCPTATLSAPIEVQAKLDIPTRQYTVQWNAVIDAGDIDLTYCIETSNNSFETKNEDNKFCVGDATQSTLDWKGQDSLAFRVVAVSANGVVSQPSDIAVVKLPDPQPVSNVVATQVQDGLQLSWNAAKQTGGLSNASHLVKWGLLAGEKRAPESGGFALGDVTTHVISRVDWEKIALPGSKIWVDVSSCTEAACAKPVSASFAFPETEVKDLPSETVVDSTVPAVSETTLVAETTVPSKQASVTTIPTVDAAYDSFCYVVGNTRRCGLYVVVLKS